MMVDKKTSSDEFNGYVPIVGIVLLSIIYVVLQFTYFERTASIEITSALQEGFAALILLLSLFIVQKLRDDKSIYPPLMLGVTTFYFALLTDFLDEIIQQPSYITYIFEDLFGILGIALIVYGIWKGITKKDLLEKELKENDARISSILSTAVDGIITIDLQKVVTSFNPAAEKLFGYSKDEVIGQNVNMLMPEPYHGNHDRYVENYLRTGEKKIIGTGRAADGRRKNGTTFPMYISIGEAIVGDNRFFTGIIHDLTKIKNADDKIRKYAEELEERLKLLEEKGVSRYIPLIKKKNSYLIKEKGYQRSLAVFCNLSKHGLTSLCFTTKHPDILQETYDLNIRGFKGETIWLTASDAEEGAINPSNLTAIHGKISEFTKNNENSVVLFLGLEYIITLSGFEKSLKFLNSLFDIITINKSRLIIALDPETLTPRELSLLENALIEIKDDDLIRLGLK